VRHAVVFDRHDPAWLLQKPATEIRRKIMSRRSKSIEELLRILRDPRSVPDLRTYFNLDRPDDLPQYTGARFDTLDDGGARDGVRDTITPYDLLAVACLEVIVPTPVGLDLVGGQLGQEIGALLREIPANVALGEVDADQHVKHGSPADQAWSLLEAETDVGWVTAGKVMARKRPHLIPVWDRVVKCAFGRPKDAWLWLDGRLQDGRLREELDQLRQAAQLPDLVSRLRVLDVVLWMRHRPEHLRTGCPGLEPPPAN
jgi:Family of unknown function (DUF6308)